MALTWLFVTLAAVAFVVVIWNLLLPLPGSQNKQFVGYLMDIFKHNYENNTAVQTYIDKPVISPIRKQISSLVNDTSQKLEEYSVGPIIHATPKQNNVTLTFYVEYGNNKFLPDLLDLLYKYKIDKAVFFVDNKYAKENPIMLHRIQYDGYIVHNWQTVGEYDKNYYPTVFDGTILVDKEILSKVKSDHDAVSFLEIATTYSDSSIIAFTPKIIKHEFLLESLLKHNGKDIKFTDTNKTSIENFMKPTDTQTDALNKNPEPILQYLGVVNLSETIISSGNWTMALLAQKFPDTVQIVPENRAFLIIKPILVEKDANLDLSNQNILLLSAKVENYSTTLIEVRGNVIAQHTTISSYDPAIKGPDTNGYHPRPFILVRDGGTMNLFDSSITYLGYSLGGFEDTRFSRAAIAYYNTTNVNIENSTLAHNYYGFYSAYTDGIRITNSKVFGNVRYGLDPHTWSSNLYVYNNHIYDNGNQGFICSLHCLNVNVINNLVEHNVEGIGIHWLTNSSVIKDNIVRYNAKFGIFVQKSSFNNLVFNNTVIGNKYGIGLEQGSNGNNVTQNILVDNVISQIKIEPDSQSNNVFNNTFYSSAEFDKIPQRIKLLISNTPEDRQ